jgi:hypothetical protein
MNFIRDNQACKAQDIVDGIKKNLSRVPVFDTLRDLVKEGTVTDEKINRREHRYFLNDDNLLVSIPRELDQFKDYFFRLIDEVNRRFDTKIKEHDKKYPEHLREDDPDDLEWKILGFGIKRSRLSYSLVALYQHVVGMYVLGSLFIWPKKIRNNEAINKLYTEVFNRLQEIQKKLTSELFDSSNEFLDELVVERLFELKADELDVIARNFYRIGVDKQIEPVLDSLWEISNKSIPFGLFGSPKSRDLVRLIAKNGKLEDWRIFVG